MIWTRLDPPQVYREHATRYIVGSVLLVREPVEMGSEERAVLVGDVSALGGMCDHSPAFSPAALVIAYSTDLVEEVGRLKEALKDAG